METGSSNQSTNGRDIEERLVQLLEVPVRLTVRFAMAIPIDFNKVELRAYIARPTFKLAAGHDLEIRQAAKVDKPVRPQYAPNVRQQLCAPAHGQVLKKSM